jgi:hypothetical protein
VIPEQTPQSSKNSWKNKSALLYNNCSLMTAKFYF